LLKDLVAAISRWALPPLKIDNQAELRALAEVRLNQASSAILATPEIGERARREVEFPRG
jgi:hypothetical protein